MWATRQPIIIIKKLGDSKYTWVLCLSNNKRKPTCVAPTVYENAFKCREMARRFASKFKSQMRLISPSEKIDEVMIIDETRKHIDGDVLDATGEAV
jgi:hypothetical protein